MIISQNDIQELDRLEKTVNGDMGVSCVRAILHYLQRGENTDAATVRQVEGDKTRQYPALEAHLYKMFGCRLHNFEFRKCGDFCDKTRKFSVTIQDGLGGFTFEWAGNLGVLEFFLKGILNADWTIEKEKPGTGQVSWEPVSKSKARDRGTFFG